MADDLCFSNNKPPLIPTPFFYDLSLLCSFIFSHPLYFSCFLFFSPYFIKFISLFSPLFFTTALLLLLSVLATTFPTSNKLGFIQSVVDHVRSKLKDVDEQDDKKEFCDFEDFEIYKIVFRDVQSTMLITAGDGDQNHQMEEMSMSVIEVVGKSEEEKSLERLFEELDRFEDFADVIEIKEKESSSDLVEIVGELQKSEAVEKLGGKSMAVLAEMEELGGKSMAVTSEMEKLGGKFTAVTTEMEKLGGKSMAVTSETKKCGGKSMAVTEKLGGKSMAEMEKLGGKSMAVTEKLGGKSMAEMEKLIVKSMAVTSEMEKLGGKSMAVAAEATISGEDQKTVTDPFIVRSNSLRLDSCSSFGSYGSMRKEKEWKRTLACKLFEERHNSEGGEEGMDSLWEVHETDTSAMKSKKKKDAMVKHKKSLTKNKTEFKYDDEDDDDDEFMMNNGQLCCLKALKLSAGKMNLGMGKPNLVKISKALKGFGWLHHVGTKNGKRI